MKTTLLTVPDVREIVRAVGLHDLMDQTIEGLDAAFAQFDPAQTELKIRDGFSYDRPSQGLIEWMPAREAEGLTTIKIVGYHPENPRRHQLPTILSTVSVFDSRTGHLEGLLDGTFLTALRTGAASAVATRILARTGSDTLGLIGCGAQAVSQFHALSRVLELKTVLIHDIDKDHESSFSRRVEHLLPDGVKIVASPLKEILSRADVICTQTSIAPKDGPVFADGPTRPHLHVNAVGSDFPEKTELPQSLLERAFVTPDFHAQAVKEGECQQLPADRIGPELARLARNPFAYESVRNAISVFDSTGTALEDSVTGQILLERARQLGLGTDIELESIDEDPLDPYGFVAVAASLPQSER